MKRLNVIGNSIHKEGERLEDQGRDGLSWFRSRNGPNWRCCLCVGTTPLVSMSFLLPTSWSWRLDR